MIIVKLMIIVFVNGFDVVIDGLITTFVLTFECITKAMCPDYYCLFKSENDNNHDHQRMIQHQSVLQCADPNPACVRYRGHSAHHT